MILSGKEILKQVEQGRIQIDPFDPVRLNPNSYNLRLHHELICYTDDVLDMRRQPNFRTFQIPPQGLRLQAGKLYLGRTVERTATDHYVPMLEGRSSIGRLGLFVHVSAGFGDVGFSGFWTLEIQCVQPVIIYPMVEICQIYYHTVQGEVEPYHSGKYQNNTGIQPSFLHRDFLK